MTKFKYLVLLLMLVGMVPVIRAQQSGFSPVQDTKPLEKQLEAYASELQSLSADFTQVKEMKMLEDQITSQGLFYYKSPEKIRIAYHKPFSYIMVLNGGHMTIKDGEKVQKINSSGSGMMQSINRLLLDCMRGRPFDNPDFTVSAFQSSARYQLLLVPREQSVKALFSRVEILLDKTTLNVIQLTLIEKNNDATRMSFKNIKRNAAVSDALFSIR